MSNRKGFGQKPNLTKIQAVAFEIGTELVSRGISVHHVKKINVCINISAIQAEIVKIIN